MKTARLPHLLCVPETALSVGGALVLAPSSAIEPAQASGLATPVQIERVLFAYRIPYLPDVLASPHFAGQGERERLAEALEQQGRLVANLGKWKGTAVTLRYLARSERGEVDIALMARGIARAGQSRRLGEELAADLGALLASFDLPVEPVLTEDALKAILEPISEPLVLELRQREEVVSMRRGGAYVVYSFRPPTTTWVPFFETLLRQRAPCLVSVYLEPTRLSDRERHAFTQAARLAESLAEETFEGLGGFRQRLADPQARLVARLYSDYLQRLTDPALLVAQVASRDFGAARAVAQALGAEVGAGGSLADGGRDGDRLPGGFDLVEPRDLDDLKAAWRTLQALDLRVWGERIASPGKERLPYLVDARTASAAFRFPVAIRGGIPGIRTRQPMPAHETGARPATVAPGEILLGTFADRGGAVGVPLAAFGRHALVAGFTGSGKTTTCMHLLAELWGQGIPFLVIEPAKSEYRALLDAPLESELRVFTLGDEGVSPFRLNPLEILPGMRVEAHVSALRACFEAALPTFGVLPSLIEESLHQVYLDKGWSLTDRGRDDDERLMPTLGELYFEIIRATEARGYSEKTLQDIRAAAAGRIGSLLRGSKGRMLNTRRSIPLETIMAKPTVLELESLNDEEKALVILFLLTLIREHCRATRAESRLQHVTLIEEAHRVMAATPHAGNREVSADTRAVATELFSATLSEVRAYGEGLIIAEQIPGRLAEDALKNTSVKLVHLLPGQTDRAAVSGTMNMGPEQEQYLSKLAPGTAALFVEGFERPTFITVPDYRGRHHLPERMPDERVEGRMAATREARPEALLPFAGCRSCLRQCRYRDRVTSVAYDLESARRFRQALWSYESERRRGNAAAGLEGLVAACREAVAGVGLAGDEHAAYCYFTHLWAHPLPERAAERFRQAAAEAQHGRRE